MRKSQRLARTKSPRVKNEGEDVLIDLEAPESGPPKLFPWGLGFSQFSSAGLHKTLHEIKDMMASLMLKMERLEAKVIILEEQQ